MTETIIIVLGVVCIALFAHINFNLQPKWFPGNTANTSHGAHVLLGVVETLLFLGGMFLVAVGCTIIGTQIGYASF